MIKQNQLILLSFGIKGDARGEGIIPEDNPTGHCFVLRDLILVNLFK